MRDSEHEPEVPRELVFEPDYEKARASICGGVKQADAFLRGLEEFLSKRAERGYAYRSDDPPNIATYLTKLLPSGNRIRVLYWYSAKLVRLIDAWEVPGTAQSRYYD